MLPGWSKPRISPGTRWLFWVRPLLLDFGYHTHWSRSDTSSIRSSLFEGVEENGRTYHKYHEGSKKQTFPWTPASWPQTEYYLPNDESEQTRLGMVFATINCHIGSLRKICSITFSCWRLLVGFSSHQSSNRNWSSIWALEPEVGPLTLQHGILSPRSLAQTFQLCFQNCYFFHSANVWI